jgi:hypothetical protein
MNMFDTKDTIKMDDTVFTHQFYGPGHKNESTVQEYCSWLRHCTTSRKVAGSIPDSVIESLH